MKRIILFLVPALLIIFTGCSAHSSSESSAESKSVVSQSTANDSSSQKTKDKKHDVVKSDSNADASQATEDNNDNSKSTSHTTSVENNTNNSSASTDNNSKNAKTNSDSKTTGTSSIQISTRTSAIEYLKHQLKMENNDDIAFDDMGGTLKTDKTGSYYTIKLISKSIQKNGGTGTAGLYKVYQDGTYKLKN